MTMAGNGDDHDSDQETAAPPGDAATGEDVVTITNVRPKAITPNDISANFDLDEQEEFENECYDDIKNDRRCCCFRCPRCRVGDRGLGNNILGIRDTPIN